MTAESQRTENKGFSFWIALIEHPELNQTMQVCYWPIFCLPKEKLKPKTKKF